eukprot:1182445-Prorocentrum_minimum.AAC.2
MPRSWASVSRSWASVSRSWASVSRSWASISRSWASVSRSWASVSRPHLAASLLQEGAASSNARREIQALRTTLWQKYYLPSAAAAMLLPLSSGSEPLVGGSGGAGALSLAGAPAVRMLARVGLVGGLTVRAARWLLLDRTLIRYPYPHPPQGGAGRGGGTVVFAASFNPPHLGHLRMLAYLATVADQVRTVTVEQWSSGAVEQWSSGAVRRYQTSLVRLSGVQWE